MKKKPVLLESAIVKVEVLRERIVNEATGDVELDVKIEKFQDIVINDNNRMYPKALLQREIDKITERIVSGDTVWGHPFHPDDGQGKSDEISHKWTKVWMEESGVCSGEVTIVPTVTGKNIQVLVKSGKLGLSSRGYGTSTEKELEIDGNKIKYSEINDDYNMAVPGDWVVFPSVKGAGGQAEAIRLIESELNKNLDFEDNAIKKGVTMTLKELMEKYPELFKQHETELRTAIKAEANKVVDNSATKITELTGQVTEKDTKIGTLETKVKELEDSREETIKVIRGVVSTASDIKGVLPENTDGDPIIEGDNPLKDKLSKAEADLQEAKDKVVAMEADKLAKEKVEKDKVDDAKLQTDLKEKLTDVLKKKENVVYAELVEVELIEDEKINLEKVEDVEPAVKAAIEKISKIRAATVKEQIVGSGLGEKGRIEDPEGKTSEVELREKLSALYKRTKLEGFKGTYSEWEKEYPKLVESVT